MPINCSTKAEVNSLDFSFYFFGCLIFTFLLQRSLHVLHFLHKKFQNKHITHVLFSQVCCCWITHCPLVPPETQGDPFIRSPRLVCEVSSKFAVNFIWRQSIFSKLLSLRLSRQDFTSHFIFSAPLFIFYPAASCREKVGEIYTGAPFQCWVL